MMKEVIEKLEDQAIQEAMDLVREMVDTYGVHSCLDNEDDESIWFECPICGEPILIGEDYTLDEVRDVCPVCETPYDDE